MYRSQHPSLIESLESRQFFNLAPFGAEASFEMGRYYPSSDALVASDGRYAIAYADESGLRLARFTSTGERVGQPLTVLDKPYSFSAATDSAGNIVVAYTKSSTSVPDSIADQVWFVRVSRAGTVGTPQLVDSTQIEHTNPAVSIDASGGFFVGWTEYGRYDDLFARSYNSAGVARAAKFEIDPTSSRELVIYFEMTAKPDGSGVQYGYLEYGSDGHHQALRYGGTTTTADAGNVKTMNSMQQPRIATYADGSFVMAYEQVHSPNYELEAPAETFVQRFNADGTPRSNAMKIGTMLADEGLGIDPLEIAATLDGGFVLTYIHTVGGTNLRTLYAQRFDRNGKPDDAGPVDFYAVNLEPNAPGTPQPGAGSGLGVDAAGNAVVSYGLIGPEVDFARTYTMQVNRLTSAVAALDNGTLWVLGTRRSDAMSVKQRGGSIFAAIGNNSLKFAGSRVKGIDFEGSNGNDRIFNETFIPSTIRGGSGNDIVQGGAGNDLIRGNTGDDDLNGNDGNDQLLGDAGNDYLAGNNGNDRLDGGAGRDRIYGYAGNDSIFASDGEIDQLFGNGGRDTFDRDGKDSVVD